MRQTLTETGTGLSPLSRAITKCLGPRGDILCCTNADRSRITSARAKTPQQVDLRPPSDIDKLPCSSWANREVLMCREMRARQEDLCNLFRQEPVRCERNGGDSGYCQPHRTPPARLQHPLAQPTVVWLGGTGVWFWLWHNGTRQFFPECLVCC